MRQLLRLGRFIVCIPLIHIILCIDLSSLYAKLFIIEIFSLSLFIFLLSIYREKAKKKV